MKGEASVEVGGNWEERESGAARGLLKAGSGGTLGREVETEGELIVPGRGSEVDRPEKQRETSNQRELSLYSSACHFLTLQVFISSALLFRPETRLISLFICLN